MRLNSNLVLNQKYNLKAITRKTNDGVTLCDLNTKLHLGLNLPKSNAFSNIHLVSQNLNVNSHVLKWKLLALKNAEASKAKDSFSGLISSSTNFVFNNSSHKRRKQFSLFGTCGKTVMRKNGLQKFILVNKDLYCNTISNKIWFVGLHKDGKNIFNDFHLENVRIKFTPFYDKKLRKIKLEKINDNALISSTFLSNLIKNYKNKSHFVLTSKDVAQNFLRYSAASQNNQVSFKKGYQSENKDPYFQSLLITSLINNKFVRTNNLLLKDQCFKET